MDLSEGVVAKIGRGLWHRYKEALRKGVKGYRKWHEVQWTESGEA